MVYEIRNANVMRALGSYKADTLKRYVGTISSVDLWDFEGGSGCFGSQRGMQFKLSSDSAGQVVVTDYRAELNIGDSSETVPRHTALNYYIYVY